MVKSNDKTHNHYYKPVERCASAEATPKRQQNKPNFVDHGLPPICVYNVNPFYPVKEYRKLLFLQGKSIGGRPFKYATSFDSFRHDRSDRISLQIDLEVSFGDFDKLGDM